MVELVPILSVPWPEMFNVDVGAISIVAMLSTALSTVATAVIVEAPPKLEIYTVLPPLVEATVIELVQGVLLIDG